VTIPPPFAHRSGSSISLTGVADNLGYTVLFNGVVMNFAAQFDTKPACKTVLKQTPHHFSLPYLATSLWKRFACCRLNTKNLLTPRKQAERGAMRVHQNVLKRRGIGIVAYSLDDVFVIFEQGF
jgi:hypothetical protein